MVPDQRCRREGEYPSDSNDKPRRAGWDRDNRNDGLGDGGAARVGMDVYWANRGGAPAPTDGTALREEPDFRGLLETLGVASG